MNLFLWQVNRKNPTQRGFIFIKVIAESEEVARKTHPTISRIYSEKEDCKQNSEWINLWVYPHETEVILLGNAPKIKTASVICAQYAIS